MKSGRTMTSAVSETSVGSVYAGPIFFFVEFTYFGNQSKTKRQPVDCLLLV